ncbi:MAG: CAAX prenyl protease-related protein [Bryobacteraceae bacterium]
MTRTTAACVGPFAVFVALMALLPLLGVDTAVGYPVQSVAALAVWWLLSRRLFPWRPVRPIASALLGMAIFVVWVAPDALWPGYRSHWLFENTLTGSARSSIEASSRSDPAFLAFRVFGSVVVVPLIEELFWRGWLMRWLAGGALEQMPVGTYSPRAFWLTAILFGLEHGPYWDVGLVAGVAYNWWVVKARSLADCILAHGVTNACLAAYVLASGKWSYWL